MRANDLTTLLWVAMRVAAISANAGSVLVQTTTEPYSLRTLRPFIDGVSLMIWGWGTWWSLLLAIFGCVI
jgi:hypothetical protein